MPSKLKSCRDGEGGEGSGQIASEEGASDEGRPTVQPIRPDPWTEQYVQRNAIPRDHVPEAWLRRSSEPGKGFTNPQMKEILRTWLLEGVSQDVLWDVVNHSSPKEFQRLKLSVSLREARDNGTAVLNSR